MKTTLQSSLTLLDKTYLVYQQLQDLSWKPGVANKVLYWKNFIGKNVWVMMEEWDSPQRVILFSVGLGIDKDGNYFGHAKVWQGNRFWWTDCKYLYENIEDIPIALEEDVDGFGYRRVARRFFI